MKRTYILLFAFPIIAFVTSSCEGKLDDLVEKGEYTVSTDANYATFANFVDSFDVESSSTTKMLSVKSAGSDWRLSSDESWIHFTPSSGTGNMDVKCSFDDNPYAYKKRSGKIFLSTGKSTISTKVIQNVSDPNTECDPSSISMGAAGGTTTVNVKSNCTNIRVADCPDYVEASYSDGKLVVTVSPNMTRSYRSDNIKISYDYRSSYYYEDGLRTGTTYVSVYQDSPAFSVSPSYINYVSAEGQTFNVELSSDLPWKVEGSEYSWLQYSPAHGDSGMTTMTITVSPNDTYDTRYGYINIYVGSYNIKSIEIRQYGKSRY